jgi:hypothetical protein
MKRKTSFWLAVAAFLVVCHSAMADVTGTIWGTVRDPSGAAVAKASVFLYNPDTGFKRQASTQVTGAFEFLVVPVGRNYVLEVEVPGFQKFVQSGLHLLVNQHFLVNVDLAVGGASQQITVSAAEAQVETSSTQVGDVIEDRKMTGLPLNGRSFIDLMGLQAGVVPITSGVGAGDRPISGELNAGNVAVNGNRETGNSFLVNGGDVEESKNNGATISPTLDSIQEFRVLTNSFDAEFGRFSGGIVNVVTKSGTNELHGTLFEFLRNEKLDARNFFDMNQTDPSTGQQIPNSARGVFKRNQFGGAVGGPIWKNRLFFFNDYQGTQERRGISTGTVFLPSLAERNGDFSDTATTGFSPLAGIVKGENIPGGHTLSDVLSQRLGYTVKAGEPYWTPGCTTLQAAQDGICVFPNQVIPQSAWGPVAKATLKYIATPNGMVGGTPFYSSSGQVENLSDNKLGERINFNNKLTGDWSFYYHFDDASVLNPYAGSNIPGFPGTTKSRAQQINASNTHIFSPTAINELRLNYTRFAVVPNVPSGEGVGPISSFGFVEGGLGIIPAIPSREGMPDMYFGGSYNFSLGPPAAGNPQINNTYQVSDAFSKIVGKHSLKFGADFRKIQMNIYNISFPNGQFSLSGAETGNAFADYLIGTPDNFQQASQSTLFSRSKYLGAFVQDSYKLKPNVTLNIGLRWDLIQPFTETQNRLNVINWGQQSTLYPGAPTGWVFPGDQGISSTVSPTGYKNFAPRVGLAYSPGFHDGPIGKIFGGPGKTSIRVAFGIYYTAVEDMPAAWTIGDAPFGLFVNNSNTYFEAPFEDRRANNDRAQPFPWVPPLPGAKINWQSYLPIGGSPAIPLDNVTPRVMHWNFTFQRELAKSTILTLGYIGTRGRHLLVFLDSNPASAARCLQIAQILTAQGNPGAACGPYGADQIYDLNGDGKYELGIDAFGTRPHSITSGLYASKGILDFAGGSDGYNKNIGNSDYDAFQVTFNKKAGPLQFLAAYTWSKSLDDTSGFLDGGINPYNYGLSKSLSAFDMAHNFVVSYAYDLPFHKLATHGFAGKVLEGWQVSGITRFTTGLPITMGEGDNRSLSDFDLPNYSGAPIQFLDPRASNTHAYFSTTPFSLETLGVIGDANRRFFHGPGLNNWDVMLQKVTRFHERYAAELRIEYFNIVNHAQFGNPQGNINSSAFGDITYARDPRIGQVALKLYF